jgi:DNA-binding beta-propeller fold protein YncE
MIQFEPGLYLRRMALAASLMLAGCAAPGSSTGDAVERKLLSPWLTVTGSAPAMQPFGVRSASGYIQLMRPTAIGAVHGDVYLVDAGLRRIFRYDRAQQSLTAFSDLPADDAMGLYAAPDMTVYVTDPNRRRVLQFTREGRLLRTFSDSLNLSRPLAVALDDKNGRVLVADGLHDHIVAFDRLGQPLSAIDSRGGEKPHLSIAGMAAGPDGLYLVDRLARQVVVLDVNGAYRRAFGKGTLAEPGAIAVDRANRVFVGDNFDNTIKVYVEGGLVGTFGGSGGGPGQFNHIAGLVESQGLLYVADSLNARIQIMLVAPAPKPGPKPAGKIQN